MGKGKSGHTLVELLAVLALLSILAAIALPAFHGMLEKAKREIYGAQARDALNSAQALLMAELSTGQFDPMDFSEKICSLPLGHEDNVLKMHMAGGHSPDAQVASMVFNMYTGQIKEFIYQVGGCQVEIRAGQEITVVKLDNKTAGKKSFR